MNGSSFTTCLAVKFAIDVLVSRHPDVLLKPICHDDDDDDGGGGGGGGTEMSVG